MRNWKETLFNALFVTVGIVCMVVIASGVRPDDFRGRPQREPDPEPMPAGSNVRNRKANSWPLPQRKPMTKYH
jgi:hypothetical protein